MNPIIIFLGALTFLLITIWIIEKLKGGSDEDVEEKFIPSIKFPVSRGKK